MENQRGHMVPVKAMNSWKEGACLAKAKVKNLVLKKLYDCFQSVADTFYSIRPSDTKECCR